MAELLSFFHSFLFSCIWFMNQRFLTDSNTLSRWDKPCYTLINSFQLLHTHQAIFLCAKRGPAFLQNTTFTEVS